MRNGQKRTLAFAAGETRYGRFRRVWSTNTTATGTSRAESKVMNASAVAFTRAGVYRVGVACTFQRLVGSPPSVTLSPAGGARVTAVVRNYLPDTTQESATGYSASQVGSISQGDRQILVMADDLAAAGFVLPVRKGDQVLVADSIATPVGPASPSVAAGAATRTEAAVVAGASSAAALRPRRAKRTDRRRSRRKGRG